MQARTSFLPFLILAISNLEIESAPLAKLFSSGYQHPQTIELHPEYFQVGAYQNAPAPYYVYNLLQVHADLTAGSPTILPDKQTTTLAHLAPYGYYYGMPVYDFRFPFNTIFPVLSPPHPGFIPGSGSPPISTQRPFDVDNDDDSGIEKLDTKLDPETGMRKPGDQTFDDDTISIEAL